MKFIHLTDTHVIAGDRTLYGAHPTRRLARAVDSINAEHGDATCVVVTGDLTHWGDAGAYETFAAEIQRLAMPVHLMLGNHDARPAFRAAFPEAPVDANGFVQMIIETEAGRFLCLDTLGEGTHAGVICADRLAWLRAALEASDGPVFLFLHHPPFAIGIPAMDGIALQHPEAFHAVIAPHIPRIRHLFFGHAHRAIFGNWRGISYSCMRGLNQQIDLDLTPGSSGLYGNLATPAYGVVLLDDATVTVHLHDFAEPSPKFALLAPEGGDTDAYQLAMRHPGGADI